MIGPLDEHLAHQTEMPVAQVASEHPAWQDRFYFNIHDMEGNFVAITGLGAYPNRQTMDAYLFVVYKGNHYSLYRSRPLRGDRHDMKVEELSYRIVDPLRAWQLELSDAENGISASLEFQARCPPLEFSPIYWEKEGRLVVKQYHYTQAGRYRGRFQVGGDTIEGLIGMRDRSWGIRVIPDVDIWIWISAQFPRYCISAWLWESRAGQLVHFDGGMVPEEGPIVRLTAMEHQLELWPGTRRPRGGLFRLTSQGGERWELEAQELVSIFIGGPGPKFSLDDKDALAQADRQAIGFDQFCRFRMGADEGYGIVEFMVVGGSERYSIPPASLPLSP